MTPEDFERSIGALLDARPLPTGARASDDCAGPKSSLLVVDAIARIHRIVMFGKDVPPDPPMTGWGHLEIRDEIGRGTTGTVYRAWDPRLARAVALKLFAADGLDADAALDEGRRLACLDHPHIVRVFGADIHDGVAGIWMELLEGDTLEDVLARDGPFSSEETALAGIDLAGALAAVHSAGLLHRDVKARNVLRERGGRLVLMDLGSGQPVDSARVTGAAGTPLYMAPEVLAGAPATFHSDLYSLGMLLYQLLTGTFPVVARDLEALRAHHRAGRRTTLAARHPSAGEIGAAIERACEFDPSLRYPTAGAFETALIEAIGRQLDVHAAPATASARLARRWRRPASVVLATVVMTTLVVGLNWNSSRGRSIRRSLALTVPPRSTLYVSMNGGIGVIDGRTLRVVSQNPATALAIAASSDRGVLTMASIPPWTVGGSFDLSGTPRPPPTSINELCCFYDGTTDGHFNYAARQDSTLLEPVGSRPLAPVALYRFDRDWSHPQPLFPLAAEGIYLGVAYSDMSRTFWLTRKVQGGAVIEQWNPKGQHLSTPVSLPAGNFAGIAVDPRDHTLWVVKPQYGGGVTRLENFDASGRFLAGLELPRSVISLEPLGAEFAWVGEWPPGD